MDRFRPNLQKAVHFFFPSTCLVCKRVLVEGENCNAFLLQQGICRTCLAELPLRLSEERWHPCLSDRYEEDPVSDFYVWVMFHYDQSVPELLRRLKFSRAKYCGTAMGSLMAQELPSDLPFRPHAILPIPLSEQRLAQRGYNQAAVIGAKIAERLEVPMLENVLVRTRHTGQQSRVVDPKLREQNIEGAFAVSEEWDIRGWNILLVDDILTSGATLHEAAKVLRLNHAAILAGAVCASHRQDYHERWGKDTKKRMNCH